MVLVAAAPLAMATTEIIKGEKGPNASAKTWEYVPQEYGIWTGHIVNSGLRWLVIDVYDNSTGVPEEIMHQRIRFAAYDAYPTGWVDTQNVTMAVGHAYEITGTPNGPRGSSCTVEDMFKPAMPPVALFSVVKNYLNVVVDATDSYDPDGSIVSYAWDFGDQSSVVMGLTATHTYAAGATYTITLTVTDNDGLTGELSQDVTVVPPPTPPVAKFTATMDWMVVSVDASASYDSDGTIQSYAWDFGDGDTGTDVSTSHTYLVEKTYTITLTVTDNDGMTGQATTDVVARMPHPPVASFTAVVTHFDVVVDASASYDSDGTIQSYAWDFGDGETATGMSATHTYLAKGTFTITLAVKDNDGLYGSAEKVVDIIDNFPKASFTYSVSGLTVNVNAAGSSDDYGIVSYTWDWGDGSAPEVYTSSSATHTYTYAYKGAILAVTPQLVVLAGGAPGPPYPVAGYTYDSLGAKLPSCDLTITDLNTGEFTTAVSDLNGFYSVDLGSFAAWTTGDIVEVTAVKGTLAGENQGVVAGSYLRLDVTLFETAPLPFDVIITLTVTDTIGQTNTVYQTVTVYP